uniref:preprotein translocase subunit SecY n=1 Tax=Ochrosphaera neapolitana TaxID=35137 RepID=UPI00286ADA05|nr:preprotein translocase subunit SecY [Ochrosphaera neapolitana]WKK50123.1 preprotein translocase subunit SecY [Ochrosphaera neapolitana]
MVQTRTKTLLRNKIVKILSLLLLVRVGLYLPVPGVDLDILSKGSSLNPLFGFAKSLVGNSFLGIGTLGILPYINASIVIQLLTPLFPALERLQKEEGEFGRQQLTKYTRYLTFLWALVLSAVTAFFLVKPLVFDWSLIIGFQVTLALTVGSILSMWFAELITEEGLGNGSSMIIFINIVGGIPNNMGDLNTLMLNQTSFESINLLFKNSAFYLLIVLTVILFQDSYKKIHLISAKQLNTSTITETKLTESFIPLKLNQGGIMPLVFSSTVATFMLYPAQLALSSLAFITPAAGTQLLTIYSLVINIVLIIFFSCFYVSLALKPKDMAENLSKMAYTIQGIRQGKATRKYLEKISNRLAFVSGIFLAILAFFPILAGSFLNITIFKNLTSLLILVGVVTDTTSQIQGYLVSTSYEVKKT